MNEAGKLLSQAKDLDYEELCTRAFVITSESAIIDPKIPLDKRVELAYEALQARLHNPRSVSGGQLPEEPDYYDLLELDENATQEEIEEAYKQRKASLQPEVLEKELRAKGLSESKIKEKLQEAKTTRYYVENAHKILGDETRRDHYDEHLKNKRQDEWKDTLDYEQKKAIDKKTDPINHGENWKLLDVTPGATQLDLRTAFLVQVREHDPERYLQKLKKSKDKLTPEEIKEYNIRQERWSNVNRAYAEELDEVQLTAERKERKSSRSGDAQQNIIITATPTIPAIEPSQITINFREKIIDGTGIIIFTPEETALLISEGVIPPGTTSEQLSASAEVATKHLLPLGVDAQQFSDEVDRAAKSNLITQQQEKDLQLSAWILETEQKSNPELADAFKKEAGMPNVSITTLTVSTDSPQTAEKPNQITLQTGDNGFLRPLFDKGIDLVKGKADKLLTKGLEKIGITGGKEALKKFATEAMKKGGKELLKLGSKIATKVLGTAALQTLASLAPGVGNAIMAVAQWLGEKVLKPLIKFATKAIKGLLKFITGKDDLKSQLKELSGVALVASLATGAFVPAAISGVVFFSAIGAGSIIGGVGGVASAVFLVITSTVLAVSAPIIVGAVTFVILVIFITIIINNSAFVVPYGGINVPPGQSPLPGTPHPSDNSAYFQVSKLARSDEPPRGHAPYLEYDNEDLSVEVFYRIDISAPDSDLLDIRVVESCTTTGNSPDLICPDRSQWLPIPPLGYIPATETFSIEYSRTFTRPGYEDSLTTDIVQVTARIEGETAQTAIASAQVCIGDCPVDCPSGWPTEHGYITQGPDTPPPMSHSNNDAAIDIGIQGLTQPVYVYSTHGGTVRAFYSAGGGNTVEISSNCNGVEFRSSYQHLAGSFDDFVSNGDVIGPGIPIGIVDNTGSSSEGTHLHYEFIDSIPKPGGMLMQPPYIPEVIQPSSDCCSACGTSYDPFCTTSW